MNGLITLQLEFPDHFLSEFLHISMKIHFILRNLNFLVIFKIPWVSISLTERNNCSFPARLREFFLNSGSKGLKG